MIDNKIKCILTIKMYISDYLIDVSFNLLFVLYYYGLIIVSFIIPYNYTWKPRELILTYLILIKTFSRDFKEI